MANIFDLFRKIEKGREPVGPVTHLVVGLGNPGPQYENTRHNTGFLVVDKIAERLGVRIDRTRFKALTGEATVADKRVLLLKPQTFMNLSGEAVREAAAFYKIAPEHVIVICDDVCLPVGRLRVRGKGSDGGHNGIGNIIAQLGTEDFPRIRVGVGERPDPAYDLADWVLSAFPPAERESVLSLADAVFEGLELILRGDLAAAQQRCNGASPC